MNDKLHCDYNDSAAVCQRLSHMTLYSILQTAFSNQLFLIHQNYHISTSNVVMHIGEILSINVSLYVPLSAIFSHNLIMFTISLTLLHERSKVSAAGGLTPWSSSSVNFLSVQCYAWTEYQFTCVCVCMSVCLCVRRVRALCQNE